MMNLSKFIFLISSLFFLTGCGDNVDPKLKELIKCISAAETMGDINSALIAKDDTLKAFIVRMTEEGKPIPQSDLVNIFRKAISEVNSDDDVKKVYYSSYCQDAYSTLK